MYPNHCSYINATSSAVISKIFVINSAVQNKIGIQQKYYLQTVSDRFTRYLKTIPPKPRLTGQNKFCCLFSIEKSSGGLKGLSSHSLS